jgi:hypothetical protein
MSMNNKTGQREILQPYFSAMSIYISAPIIRSTFHTWDEVVTAAATWHCLMETTTEWLLVLGKVCVFFRRCTAVPLESRFTMESPSEKLDIALRSLPPSVFPMRHGFDVMLVASHRNRWWSHLQMLLARRTTSTWHSMFQRTSLWRYWSSFVDGLKFNDRPVRFLGYFKAIYAYQ